MAHILRLHLLSVHAQALVLVDSAQVSEGKLDAATFHLDCNGLPPLEAGVREVESEKLHFLTKLQAEVLLSQWIPDFFYFCAAVSLLLLLFLLIKALDNVTQTDLLGHLKLALYEDEGSQRFIIHLKLLEFARLPL